MSEFFENSDSSSGRHLSPSEQKQLEDELNAMIDESTTGMDHGDEAKQDSVEFDFESLFSTPAPQIPDTPQDGHNNAFPPAKKRKRSDEGPVNIPLLEELQNEHTGLSHNKAHSEPPTTIHSPTGGIGLDGGEKSAAATPRTQQTESHHKPSRSTSQAPPALSPVREPDHSVEVKEEDSGYHYNFHTFDQSKDQDHEQLEPRPSDFKMDLDEPDFSHGFGVKSQQQKEDGKSGDQPEKPVESKQDEPEITAKSSAEPAPEPMEVDKPEPSKPATNSASPVEATAVQKPQSSPAQSQQFQQTQQTQHSQQPQQPQQPPQTQHSQQPQQPQQPQQSQQPQNKSHTPEPKPVTKPAEAAPPANDKKDDDFEVVSESKVGKEKERPNDSGIIEVRQGNSQLQFIQPPGLYPKPSASASASPQPQPQPQPIPVSRAPATPAATVATPKPSSDIKWQEPHTPKTPLPKKMEVPKSAPPKHDSSIMNMDTIRQLKKEMIQKHTLLTTYTTLKQSFAHVCKQLKDQKEKTAQADERVERLQQELAKRDAKIKELEVNGSL